MKKIKFIVIFTFGLFSLCFAAEESITITTYYPSPHGSYSSLQTDKFGVGDNNGDGLLTSADVPTTTGNVWIKGNVGIGNTSPSAGLKIDVEGKIGATQYCDQNGNNCVVSSGIRSSQSTRVIMFSVRFGGGTSFSVESTRVLLTNDPNDFNYNVIITNVSHPGDGHYLIRAHFRDFYMDSDEVVSANLVLTDNNTHNLGMCDEDGNNQLEFIISDGDNHEDLRTGDEIKFMVAWPTVN